VSRSYRGLVLAAGLGRRLRPLTNDRPKGALPVADEIIAGHNVLKLARAGVEEIGVVVGHKASKLKEALGDGSSLGVRIRYFVQPEPKGTADAVLRAKEFCQPFPFILAFGDNVSDAELSSLLDLHEEGLSVVTVAVRRVDDPRKFGVVSLRDSWVVEVEEKPRKPKSNLAIAGFFCIEPEFLSELERVPERVDGERNLTDALARLASLGKVRAWTADFWRVNVNTGADLLTANEGLLSRKEGMPANSFGFEVLPPSYLHPDAEVERGAVIGPYTTVCQGAIVGEEARVERSILLPGAKVGRGARLVNCIVGEGAVVPAMARLAAPPQRPIIIPHFSSPTP